MVSTLQASSRAPDSIECINPATGEELGRVPVDKRAAVEQAVERARQAQLSWRDSSFRQRRELLRSLADMVLERTDDICDLVSRDSGKTHEHALMGEVWPVCEKLRWTLRNGEKHLRREAVSPGLLMHKRAYIEYMPLGVIGAIVPWNYPFQNLMNPVVTALMAGNAVVVKPSEWVAYSSLRFAQMIHEVLRAHNLSPHLVSVVNGYGETGQALIESGVDGVLFIGSVENGRKVLATAAQSVTPVVAELGGKDPFVICDDADLEHAIDSALTGCFVSAGQNCVASERLLVFEEVAPEVEARLAAKVRSLHYGAPEAGRVLDVGSLTTPQQRQIVKALVEDALAKGARLLAGGVDLDGPGCTFAPTLLAGVTEDMNIMHQETFGPVMVIVRVRDEAHAIEVANRTSLGLSASVFSRDRSRARRIARAIQSGMCAINDFGGMTYMAQDLPFGGVKRSGFGRMNGRDGLRAFTQARAVLDDRFPFSVPARAFPVRKGDLERTKAALRILYGRGFQPRLRGVEGLLRAWRGRG